MSITSKSLEGASAVRLAAAFEAGKTSARLRLAGYTPNGEGNPVDHAAYQWAEAVDMMEPKGVRAMFVAGFMQIMDDSRPKF